jgi:carboxylesterase type B
MVLDCLFLDIYVPGKVLRDGGQAKKTLLPVIAWIHGGG